MLSVACHRAHAVFIIITQPGPSEGTQVQPWRDVLMTEQAMRAHGTTSRELDLSIVVQPCSLGRTRPQMDVIVKPSNRISEGKGRRKKADKPPKRPV
jgi:hypothetical protein